MLFLWNYLFEATVEFFEKIWTFLIHEKVGKSRMSDNFSGKCLFQPKFRAFSQTLFFLNWKKSGKLASENYVFSRERSFFIWNNVLRKFEGWKNFGGSRTSTILFSETLRTQSLSVWHLWTFKMWIRIG